MTDYRLKNVGAGRYLNLHTSTTGSAVPSACPISIYNATSSSDQVFVHDTHNGKPVLKLKRNTAYALNRHSGTNACIAWPLTSATVKDSEYDTETANGKVRIKLPHHNLYLTAASTANGAKCSWQPKKADSDKNVGLQCWVFEAAGSGSAGTGSATAGAKTLPMPVNANQKYKGYNSTINASGCSVCCGVNVSSYYGGSGNNNVPYFYNNYWTKGVGYSWNSPNAKITEAVYSLPTIKAEIDTGRPVIVRAASGARQHWVVAYGYKNGCKTASDVTVLDPYNANTASTVGSVRTLAEAMRISVGSGYAFGRIKKTARK